MRATRDTEPATRGQWVICDYFEGVAPDPDGTTQELKLLAIGAVDYSAGHRSARNGWGPLWDILVARPTRQAIRTRQDQNGEGTFDGDRYAYAVRPCLDNADQVTGVLAWHDTAGHTAPEPPSHGAFRLHVDRTTGRFLNTGERHWTDETLRSSRLRDDQVRSGTTETEYWLANMVHPDDRADLIWRIRHGARAAHGQRNVIAFRSTSRTGPGRRYEQCALSAYGIPDPDLPDTTIIRGFWWHAQTPPPIRITGLTAVGDTTAFQTVCAAVAGFMAFAFVDAPTGTVLRTSSDWQALGLPAAEGRDVRTLLGGAWTQLSASPRPVPTAVGIPGGGAFTVFSASAPGGAGGRIVALALRKDGK